MLQRSSETKEEQKAGAIHHQVGEIMSGVMEAR